MEALQLGAAAAPSALPWPLCKPLQLPEPAALVQGSPSSTSTQEAACLSTLPRHTRVLIVGNQRTKRGLLGLEGVVKRATGLGGWHWLVRRSSPSSRGGGRGGRAAGRGVEGGEG